MKKLMVVGGILLVAIALILALMALLFPNNGFFAMLWDSGIFTFRGEDSLMVIYLTSGFFAVLGACLLVGQARSKSARNEEDV